MSFWSALVKDTETGIKDVWAFIANPKTQAVIGVGEAAIEAVDPAATALITTISGWFAEAMKVQGIAEAAAATPGATTNTQKAAAVLAATTPQVISFAQQYGLKTPTADELNTVNTYIVNILNILTGQTSTAVNVNPISGPAPVTTGSTNVAATTGAAVTGN